jgi:Uma2 family endonuclease
MNAIVQLTMDKATFLRWMDGREGRYELKDNVVIRMTGGIRFHAEITFDLGSAIRSRIDRSLWAVTASDMAVEIGDDVRFPDILVETARRVGKELFTDSPTLVAEVLSASTMAIDLNIKAAEYMSLVSLETYIVAAQDEPRLWVWNRGDRLSGRIWPKAPLEVFGKDQMVPIPALGIDVPMNEIYAAL